MKKLLLMAFLLSFSSKSFCQLKIENLSPVVLPVDLTSSFSNKSISSKIKAIGKRFCEEKDKENGPDFPDPSYRAGWFKDRLDDRCYILEIGYHENVWGCI